MGTGLNGSPFHVHGIDKLQLLSDFDFHCFAPLDQEMEDRFRCDGRPIRHVIAE
jgi:hypothetical protein